MNELDATRAKLKCLEMVEGTELNWWEVVKMSGRDDPSTKPMIFCFDIDCYEFALGVVEGKPVWKGDSLYYNGADKTLSSIPVLIDRGHNLHLHYWSWNPPKPSTITITISRECAEYFGHVGIAIRNNELELEFHNACKTALSK